MIRSSPIVVITVEAKKAEPPKSQLVFELFAGNNPSSYFSST